MLLVSLKQFQLCLKRSKMQIDQEKLEIFTQCKVHGRHLGFQKMVLRNTYDVKSQVQH